MDNVTSTSNLFFGRIGVALRARGWDSPIATFLATAILAALQDAEEAWTADRIISVLLPMHIYWLDAEALINDLVADGLLERLDGDLYKLSNVGSCLDSAINGAVGHV